MCRSQSEYDTKLTIVISKILVSIFFYFFSSLDEEAKKEGWKSIMSVFSTLSSDLAEGNPVEGPSEPINLEMITKAISKMASGNAAGASGIVAEMLMPRRPCIGKPS